MSNIKVKLLDVMGDDLAVVNAARVSFAKKSVALTERDSKLISYLVSHGHWTPFSHCVAKFHIKAPIFVRSQLFKHKVGLTENEVSRRYVDSEPEFFMPSAWRKRAENVKQGSSDEPAAFDTRIYTETLACCLETYTLLIEAGVAPEQARMVLPQAMMTEWIWTGSLAAFARIYTQRTHSGAQAETREVAVAIGEALEPLFPISWKALTQSAENEDEKL